MAELVLGIHSWYSEMFPGTQGSGEEVGLGQHVGDNYPCGI